MALGAEVRDFRSGGTTSLCDMTSIVGDQTMSNHTLNVTDKALFDKAIASATNDDRRQKLRTGVDAFVWRKKRADGRYCSLWYNQNTKALRYKTEKKTNVLSYSADKVGDAASWVGGKICDVVQNSAVKTGTSVASAVPSTYTQGAATAVNAVGGMCAGAQVAQPRIAFYHKSKKVWLVYAPSGAGLGDPLGFTPPAGYVFVQEALTKPADATDGGVVDDPFYQKPLFWAAVLGGSAVIGGAVWWKKRRG